MTFGAGQLPKAYRVHRGQKEFLPLFLVTLEANIWLSISREHRVLGNMYSVTTGTGDICVLMTTTFPADMLIIMVAGEAHTILFLNWLIRLEAKIQYRWAFLTRPHSADMASPVQRFLHRRRTGHTWAVASFALQLGKRRALIPLLTVFGFKNIEHRVIGIFVMTFDAGVRAFVSEFTLEHVFHGCRWSGDHRRLLLLFFLL